MPDAPDQPKLLLIETSTAVASVALSEGERVVASLDMYVDKAHARLVAPMVQQILANAAWKIADLSAVVVSEGPGSYTGLRVGVSTAKGICYASGLPLIGVGSLDGLAGNVLALAQHLNAHIVSMIDARRMEVYAARFSANGEALGEMQALVVEDHSFDAWLAQGPHLFVGDGVKKCMPLLSSLPGAIGLPDQLSRAVGMIPFAVAKFHSGDFADVEAFEPNYLKGVQVTKPKNPLLS